MYEVENTLQITYNNVCSVAKKMESYSKQP